ncbi:DNA-binding domain-containing protein [Kordiimonas sp. SCSIO 12610]|uniref:HvfC/BufC N-terminal domain-containing protein n=1 Tax=Kordiimonas sp. SCSIO 12610 TaxID=2829597 RepID=UPI00210D19BA|nr:DNA-binding domain-containing protein [Kordiimonas sp. SCSIO 12610]UTW54169.1 putative DNA-binding domain-containing protein [Kordiimonas sp. SCSIO 12610]
MSDLAKLQHDMKRAILGDDHALDDVSSAIIGNGLKPSQRMQIHRNNYKETLTASLKAVFPVVQAFVGEAFFEAAAKHFVLNTPPEKAQLVEYGGALAEFFETYEHAETVPYIADLLRLEWAVHVIQNSYEQTAILPDDVDAALSDETLCLVPQMQVISSEHPILSLWMVGTGQMPPEAVHVDQGGQNALVIRIDGAVQLQAINDIQLALVKDFHRGNLQGTGENASHHAEIKKMAERGMFTRAA